MSVRVEKNEVVTRKQHTNVSLMFLFAFCYKENNGTVLCVTLSWTLGIDGSVVEGYRARLLSFVVR